MREALSPERAQAPDRETENLYVVLCASGFDNPLRMRSALMFASLAAASSFNAVLYCIQGAVDVMVRGAIEKHEAAVPGEPSLAQRLAEALSMGVTVQCCSQTMANKRISPDDLIGGVEAAGAMTLIDLSTRAKGTISF